MRSPQEIELEIEELEDKARRSDRAYLFEQRDGYRRSAQLLKWVLE